MRQVGPKNIGILRATRARTQARSAEATADTPLEQLQEFQKEVGKQVSRRPSLGYRPPKFDRGTPARPLTREETMRQTVATLLNTLKNVELPTEETADA